MQTQALKDAIRPAVAAARRPAAQRRLKSLVAQPVPDAGYKVEIGCGPSRRAGWLATDITWNAPYYLDGTKPWPFPAGSVQYVYGDNVIEHLPLGSNRLLFKQAHAVMAPGGTIRLVTPDVGALVKFYLADRTQAEPLLAYHRGQGHVADHSVDVLRANFNEHGHNTGYLWDFNALAAELRAAGFRELRQFGTGESEDPLLRGLEARTNGIEAEVQLVVEATA